MTQPTQPQSFASGLESFGSIDWDAEYEELVTTEHTRPEPETAATEDTTHSEPEQLQPEGQETTNTAPLVQEPTPDHPHTLDTTFADNATPTIVASPNWTTTADPMAGEFEDISLYGEEAASATDTAAMLAPGSFAAWKHPGWCWRESSSWCEWTATSPEVSAWALSPGINEDAEWIIGACRYGDDYAHDDIPRVASLLRRAYEYAYNVPENVCLPALARGFKEVPRRGCVAERERFPRGAKGLKERRELGEYMPIGETAKARMGVYSPQPSRLSKVWSAEEEEMEKDVEVSSEISEEEWWGWFESSGGEEEEGATPDTGSSSSVESSNRVVVSTSITIKPVPLRPQPNFDGADDHEAAATDSDSEDEDQISTSSTDFVTIPITPPPTDTAEDEDDSPSSDGIANEYEGLFALYEPDNLISQPAHTTENEEDVTVEDQLSDSGSEEDNVSIGDAEDGTPATPSRLTILAPQPTDAIESEEHATGSHELANRESEDDDTSIADVTNEVEIPTTPSKPALVIPLPPRTPVRSRDALLHDPSPSPKLTGPGLLRNVAFGDMAPQISPVLLSPALALRDMNAGKKLAPVPTLYQVFVEQHGEKTVQQATKDQQDALKEQDVEEQHVGEESAGFWTTAAAAAVAIIGGFTVLLG